MSKETETLFKACMRNVQTIGTKRYVNINTELLYCDPAFQRINISSKGKINSLISHWDSDKMDTLRGSVHEDECRISIIDGYHRLMAAKALKIESLNVEIIKTPKGKTARLKREAELFATQDDDTEKMTPIQKHKAYCIIGKKGNLIIDKLCKKYSISLKTSGYRAGREKGYLTGFSEAVKIAGRDNGDGEEVLDRVFSILTEIGWKNATKGLSSDVIRLFTSIFDLHPNEAELIEAYICDKFREKDPDYIFSLGNARYPERSRKDRSVLALEDVLHEGMGLPYVYKANDPNVQQKRMIQFAA